MHGSLRLSAVLLSAGAALLVAAGFGWSAGGKSVSAVKEGGTLRVNVTGSDIQTPDPAIDYEFLGGNILLATCLKLVNFPDKPAPAGLKLVPEAAVTMPKVSADGRTYTFTIRAGLKFNTGEAVTAQTFAYAFKRVLSPKMTSPGAAFAHDIVGADAMLGKKAKTVAGIKVRGNTISFRLTAPAADFLYRVALNFFCAVPLDYPIDPKLQDAPAQAGPYYIADRVPNRSLVLKRNPNYTGSRPHHLDEMIFTMNAEQHASFLQVKKGEADYDLCCIPGTEAAGLAKTYGVNRGRFFVHPANEVDYIALNTQHGIFSDVDLRKAVNYAVDRQALIKPYGYLYGTPTDQVLPPALRGSRDPHIYPLNGPNLAKAKKLAAGKGGTAKLYYYTGSPAADAEVQILRAQLARIGIKVEAQKYTFGVLVSKTGDPKEPYDMVLIGWIADYPDPYDFINILLDGGNIQPQNNVNLAQMDIPEYNKRMKAAARLTGDARTAAYAKLDEDIMRNVAPWIPTGHQNIREFVSARVGCFVPHPLFVQMDFAAACLK